MSTTNIDSMKESEIVAVVVHTTVLYNISWNQQQQGLRISSCKHEEYLHYFVQSTKNSGYDSLETCNARDEEGGSRLCVHAV